MIQEVRKSIAFSPYVPKAGRPKDEDPAPTVNLDAKRGRLVFGAKALRKMNMVNKFVAFYYEPTRKIIGWKVSSVLEPGEKVGKNSKWSLVKPYGKGSGFWVGGVKGIVAEFRGLKSSNYKGLEVKKYIETASVLDKGTTLYFVEVREKTDRLGNEIPDNDNDHE